MLLDAQSITDQMALQLEHAYHTAVDRHVPLTPATVIALLQVLSEQLSTLKAAFMAEPNTVRHLARYHRATREAHEHRAQYEFCCSWDYAEGE